MLVQKVVEYYSAKGYEVISQPSVHQLPFDLQQYYPNSCPDLLIKISASQGFIVEVEEGVANLSIAHFRELAQYVAEHDGWRFLLITGEDATPIAEEDTLDQKLTRSQILQRKERIAKLVAIGEHEAAYLALWIFAEVLMRRHARQLLIPIDRLPTILMIYHLYGQSGISNSQFERVINLYEIRNRLAHGFPVKAINFNEVIEQLLNLVDEFIAMQV